MVKTTTENVIETARYFTTLNDGGKAALSSFCRDYILTEDFLIEFHDKLTKEDFSNSPYISAELAKEYPDLFDIDIWKASKTKSLDILRDAAIRDSMNDDEIAELIGSSTKTTPEIFSRVINSFKELKLKRLLGAKFPQYITIEDILATPKLSNGKVITRLSNEGKITKEDADKLLLVNLPTQVSLMVIFAVKDKAWQIEKLGQLQVSKETDYSELNELMLSLVKTARDDVLEALLYNTKRVAENVFRGESKVLHFLISFNRPSEKVCLDFYDYFKENNILRALAQYAENENYITLACKITLDK